MKTYYKIVDGKMVFAENSIILDDMRIFNPTEEQLLAAGYQEYIQPTPQPYVPTLQDVIESKISEINEYDISENVNSFTINGVSGWIDRNTRVALLHAIDVVSENGGTEYTVWFEGIPMTLPIQTIKEFLSALELYAIGAFNVTNRHIMNVRQLQTIEEVENYDFTRGYPEKVVVDI